MHYPNKNHREKEKGTIFITTPPDNLTQRCRKIEANIIYPTNKRKSKATKIDPPPVSPASGKS